MQLTDADYHKATRLIARRDPKMGALMRTIGPCGLPARQREDHLTALISAIVSQQLSTKAAATIFRRFAALFPNGAITDAATIELFDDTALRGVGLSGQKVKYVRDLCARLSDGRLRLEELDTLPDEEVIVRLTEVKGFGRWTAEMFLMFRLMRPDVLPVGDLGIVNAIQRVYKLRKRPDPKRMLALGEAWRPYRTVACWYLWQSLRLEQAAPARKAARAPSAAPVKRAAPRAPKKAVERKPALSRTAAGSRRRSPSTSRAR